MSGEEQDRGIGRLIRERADSKKELLCLQRKWDIFRGLNTPETMDKLLLDRTKGPLHKDGNTLKRGTTSLIDWLSADEIVEIVSEIEKLTASIDEITDKLKAMGME